MGHELALAGAALPRLDRVLKSKDTLMLKSPFLFVSLAGLLALSSLSGCVPAVAIGGGAAAVNMANQERTFGQAIDDITIETRINQHYFSKDVNDLYYNVDVDVSEGRVLLTGSVDEVETAIDAVNLAWQVRGVREVINELQVQGSQSPEVSAQDLWIRTQINGKYIFSKGINYSNYTIEVVNGVVYLMGIADNEDEIKLAARLASEVEHVKKVVSHIILKNDPRRGTP